MATLQLDMFTLDTDAHDTHTHSLPYIGTCRVCKRTARATDANLTAYGTLRYAYCPNRCTYNGRPVNVEYHQIKGTYNPRIRCGAKCQGATGPDCTCSCGGRNHGGRG